MILFEIPGDSGTPYDSIPAAVFENSEINLPIHFDLIDSAADIWASHTAAWVGIASYNGAPWALDSVSSGYMIEVKASLSGGGAGAGQEWTRYILGSELSPIDDDSYTRYTYGENNDKTLADIFSGISVIGLDGGTVTITLRLIYNDDNQVEWGTVNPEGPLSTPGWPADFDIDWVVFAPLTDTTFVWNMAAKAPGENTEDNVYLQVHGVNSAMTPGGLPDGGHRLDGHSDTTITRTVYVNHNDIGFVHGTNDPVGVSGSPHVLAVPRGIDAAGLDPISVSGLNIEWSLGDGSDRIQPLVNLPESGFFATALDGSSPPSTSNTLWPLYQSVGDDDGNDANGATLGAQWSPITQYIIQNPIPDNTAPVITLDGATLSGDGEYELQLEVGDHNIGSWPEPTPVVDTGESPTITGTDTINFGAIGNYLVYYNAADAAGNNADQVQLTVMVRDTTAPDLTLFRASDIGQVTASDSTGGGVNENVYDFYELGSNSGTWADPGGVSSEGTAVTLVAGGIPDLNVAGMYTLTYATQDASGNQQLVVRYVQVLDITAPIITLTLLSTSDPSLSAANSTGGGAGENVIDYVTVQSPGTYWADPGYSSNESPGSNGWSLGGDYVDLEVVGIYVITYNIDDAAGNNAQQVTRTVVVQEEVVVDSTAPVITLISASTHLPGLIAANSTGDAQNIVDYIILQTPGTNWSDAGMYSSNESVGAGGWNIGGDYVNLTAVGTYTVTYDVDDPAGNNAQQATRTIHVQEESLDALPVITLWDSGGSPGGTSIVHYQGDAWIDPGGEINDAEEGSLDWGTYIQISYPGGQATLDDSTALGTYYVYYDTADDAGSLAIQVIRTVIVTSFAVVDDPGDDLANLGLSATMSAVPCGLVDSFTMQRQVQDSVEGILFEWQHGGRPAHTHSVNGVGDATFGYGIIIKDANFASSMPDYTFDTWWLLGELSFNGDGYSLYLDGDGADTEAGYAGNIAIATNTGYGVTSLFVPRSDLEIYAGDNPFGIDYDLGMSAGIWAFNDAGVGNGAGTTLAATETPTYSGIADLSWERVDILEGDGVTAESLEKILDRNNLSCQLIESHSFNKRAAIVKAEMLTKVDAIKNNRALLTDNPLEAGTADVLIDDLGGGFDEERYFSDDVAGDRSFKLFKNNITNIANRHARLYVNNPAYRATISWAHWAKTATFETVTEIEHSATRYTVGGGSTSDTTLKKEEIAQEDWIPADHDGRDWTVTDDSDLTGQTTADHEVDTSHDGLNKDGLKYLEKAFSTSSDLGLTFANKVNVDNMYCGMPAHVTIDCIKTVVDGHPVPCDAVADSSVTGGDAGSTLYQGGYPVIEVTFRLHIPKDARDIPATYPEGGNDNSKFMVFWKIIPKHSDSWTQARSAATPPLPTDYTWEDIIYDSNTKRLRDQYSTGGGDVPTSDTDLAARYFIIHGDWLPQFPADDANNSELSPWGDAYTYTHTKTINLNNMGAESTLWEGDAYNTGFDASAPLDLMSADVVGNGLAAVQNREFIMAAVVVDENGWVTNEYNNGVGIPSDWHIPVHRGANDGDWSPVYFTEFSLEPPTLNIFTIGVLAMAGGEQDTGFDDGATPEIAGVDGADADSDPDGMEWPHEEAFRLEATNAFAWGNPTTWARDVTAGLGGPITFSGGSVTADWEVDEVDYDGVNGPIARLGSGTEDPEVDTGPTVTVSLLNDYDGDGEFTITATAGNKTDSVTVKLKDKITGFQIETHASAHLPESWLSIGYSAATAIEWDNAGHVESGMGHQWSGIDANTQRIEIARWINAGGESMTSAVDGNGGLYFPKINQYPSTSGTAFFVNNDGMPELVDQIALSSPQDLGIYAGDGVGGDPSDDTILDPQVDGYNDWLDPNTYRSVSSVTVDSIGMVSQVLYDNGNMFQPQYTRGSTGDAWQDGGKIAYVYVTGLQAGMEYGGTEGVDIDGDSDLEGAGHAVFASDQDDGGAPWVANVDYLGVYGQHPAKYTNYHSPSLTSWPNTYFDTVSGHHDFGDLIDRLPIRWYFGQGSESYFLPPEAFPPIRVRKIKIGYGAAILDETHPAAGSYWTTDGEVGPFFIWAQRSISAISFDAGGSPSPTVTSMTDTGNAINITTNYDWDGLGLDAGNAVPSGAFIDDEDPPDANVWDPGDILVNDGTTGSQSIRIDPLVTYANGGTNITGGTNETWDWYLAKEADPVGSPGVFSYPGSATTTAEANFTLRWDRNAPDAVFHIKAVHAVYPGGDPASGGIGVAEYETTVTITQICDLGVFKNFTIYSHGGSAHQYSDGVPAITLKYPISSTERNYTYGYEYYGALPGTSWSAAALAQILHGPTGQDLLADPSSWDGVTPAPADILDPGMVDDAGQILLDPTTVKQAHMIMIVEPDMCARVNFDGQEFSLTDLTETTQTFVFHPYSDTVGLDGSGHRKIGIRWNANPAYDGNTDWVTSRITNAINADDIQISAVRLENGGQDKRGVILITQDVAGPANHTDYQPTGFVFSNSSENVRDGNIGNTGLIYTDGDDDYRLISLWRFNNWPDHDMSNIASNTWPHFLDGSTGSLIANGWLGDGGTKFGDVDAGVTLHSSQYGDHSAAIQIRPNTSPPDPNGPLYNVGHTGVDSGQWLWVSSGETYNILDDLGNSISVTNPYRGGAFNDTEDLTVWTGPDSVTFEWKLTIPYGNTTKTSTWYHNGQEVSAVSQGQMNDINTMLQGMVVYDPENIVHTLPDHDTYLGGDGNVDRFRRGRGEITIVRDIMHNATMPPSMPLVLPADGAAAIPTSSGWTGSTDAERLNIPEFGDSAWIHGEVTVSKEICGVIYTDTLPVDITITNLVCPWWPDYNEFQVVGAIWSHPYHADQGATPTNLGDDDTGLVGNIWEVIAPGYCTLRTEIGNIAADNETLENKFYIAKSERVAIPGGTTELWGSHNETVEANLSKDSSDVFANSGWQHPTGFGILDAGAVTFEWHDWNTNWNYATYPIAGIYSDYKWMTAGGPLEGTNSPSISAEIEAHLNSMLSYDPSADGGDGAIILTPPVISTGNEDIFTHMGITDYEDEVTFYGSAMVKHSVCGNMAIKNAPIEVGGTKQGILPRESRMPIKITIKNNFCPALTTWGGDAWTLSSDNALLAQGLELTICADADGSGWDNEAPSPDEVSSDTLWVHASDNSTVARTLANDNGWPGVHVLQGANGIGDASVEVTWDGGAEIWLTQDGASDVNIVTTIGGYLEWDPNGVYISDANLATLREMTITPTGGSPATGMVTVTASICGNLESATIPITINVLDCGIGCCDNETVFDLEELTGLSAPYLLGDSHMPFLSVIVIDPTVLGHEPETDNPFYDNVGGGVPVWWDQDPYNVETPTDGQLETTLSHIQARSDYNSNSPLASSQWYSAGYDHEGVGPTPLGGAWDPIHTGTAKAIVGWLNIWPSDTNASGCESMVDNDGPAHIQFIPNDGEAFVENLGLGDDPNYAVVGLDDVNNPGGAEFLQAAQLAGEFAYKYYTGVFTNIGDDVATTKDFYKWASLNERWCLQPVTTVKDTTVNGIAYTACDDDTRNLQSTVAFKISTLQHPFGAGHLATEHACKAIHNQYISALDLFNLEGNAQWKLIVDNPTSQGTITNSIEVSDIADGSVYVDCGCCPIWPPDGLENEDQLQPLGTYPGIPISSGIDEYTFIDINAFQLNAGGVWLPNTPAQWYEGSDISGLRFGQWVPVGGSFTGGGGLVIDDGTDFGGFGDFENDAFIDDDD